MITGKYVAKKKTARINRGGLREKVPKKTLREGKAFGRK